MPSLKEVRNRIKSVQSTQQITKAMKMVAAARLRKAQDATIQSRPFANKLDEILSKLTSNSEILAASPYTQKKAGEKILIIVITADRGLCGPFNTNIIKSVNALLQDKYATQLNNKNVTFLTIGRKGSEYYSKRYESIIGNYSHLFQSLTFAEANMAAERIMKDFVEGKFDVVELVYNEFKNVATQIVKRVQFLPIAAASSIDIKLSKESNVDYIFEPSVNEIVEELIPKSLKIKLYRALLESNASFYGAQMTAMDKATENAGELLKDLKVTYNRSRQASITKEILEIVGGAEALSGK